MDISGKMSVWDTTLKIQQDIVFDRNWELGVQVQNGIKDRDFIEEYTTGGDNCVLNNLLAVMRILRAVP
jgi:hypothetical protein